jgi:hypothetical protein
MDAVLPHPGMLPRGSNIASPECSRRRVSLSIDYTGSSRRDPSRLSCSIVEPAFPSRPGDAQATTRSGGEWEERSHPQPRAARCCERAWRAPDLPRSEHRGTLPPVEERASADPLRSVTSRNRRHTCCVSEWERCLPRHLSRCCHPKHHFMLAVSMNFGPLVLTNIGPPSGV